MAASSQPHGIAATPGDGHFQGLAALLKSKSDVGSGGEINASLFLRQSVANVILQRKGIDQLGEYRPERRYLFLASEAASHLPAEYH